MVKDCFYLKADKGNTIAILDKADYFKRINTMISRGPYLEIKKNALPKMITNTKNMLTPCKSLLSNNYNKSNKYKLIVSNHVLHRMYCLPNYKPG